MIIKNNLAIDFARENTHNSPQEHLGNIGRLVLAVSASVSLYAQADIALAEQSSRDTFDTIAEQKTNSSNSSDEIELFWHKMNQMNAAEKQAARPTVSASENGEIHIQSMIPLPPLIQKEKKSPESPRINQKKVQKISKKPVQKKTKKRAVVVPDICHNFPKKKTLYIAPIKKQKTYFTLCKDGKLVKTGLVSTGQPRKEKGRMRGSYTPARDFTVVSKTPMHRSSLYEGARMPWAMNLSGTNFFLHQGKTNGNKLSHGCIRLKEPDAKFLYQSMPIGTRVVIEGTNPRQTYRSLYDQNDTKKTTKKSGSKKKNK